jgi:PleD family two-component response regulator
MLRQLRAMPRTAHLPVMFIAPLNEADVQKTVLREGADDFIVKPFDLEILGLRVRNAIARTERDGLTNPHTGLPTGRLLEEQCAQLTALPDRVRLDITVAHFAAFRECYDFITADEVLLFAAKLLAEVSQELGTETDFIGHYEHSHFVLVTHRDTAAPIQARLAARFDEEVQAFYNFMDRDQGYVLVEDGYGDMEQVPLMTLQVTIKPSLEA